MRERGGETDPKPEAQGPCRREVKAAGLAGASEES